MYIVIWFSMAASVNLQLMKKPFKKMIEEIDPEAAAAMELPKEEE